MQILHIDILLDSLFSAASLAMWWPSMILASIVSKLFFSPVTWYVRGQVSPCQLQYESR